MRERWLSLKRPGIVIVAAALLAILPLALTSAHYPVVDVYPGSQTYVAGNHFHQDGVTSEYCGVTWSLNLSGGYTGYTATSGEHDYVTLHGFNVNGDVRVGVYWLIDANQSTVYYDLFGNQLTNSYYGTIYTNRSLVDGGSQATYSQMQTHGGGPPSSDGCMRYDGANFRFNP